MTRVLFINACVVILCWALWARRATWANRWQVPTTLSMALLATSVLMLDERMSEWLGQPLHAITGYWNVEDLLGHLLFLGAAGCLVVSVLMRLGDDDSIQGAARQFLERPAAVVLAAMLWTFCASQCSNEYIPDFLQAPVDVWLVAYRLIVGLALVYQFGLAMVALLVLRQDTEHKMVATAYLVVCAAGTLSALLYSIAAMIPGAGERIATLEWALTALFGVGFVVANSAKAITAIRAVGRLYAPSSWKSLSRR
ncbi:hypothetical protein SEA_PHRAPPUCCINO_39 [Mycobacterium phage Phrappuccino]|uniref:Uncharacterized protein n=1 Tax=Mycobacterium phage Phrappuccino TaxID=2591223 RepID=A0A514DDP0_9CAUD|nr:hypothetical protein KHQ87_gp039 [Mycobacterium phage Phrappuccino]QDH91717.1 hypothetical protein SEA_PHRAPPUCCINO_39 [Mycobacterium phage Phrappuccino]QIQ63160.1 hypothetical protein SEA_SETTECANDELA_39 [Mycobacterium phage Settecandela]